jgi:hypothetical protein
MTANQYQVLLGLYVFPEYHICEQWQINAVKDLIDNCFISLNEHKKYKLAGKAECLIKHILDLPMPVQTWNMP